MRKYQKWNNTLQNVQSLANKRFKAGSWYDSKSSDVIP